MRRGIRTTEAGLPSLTSHDSTRGSVCLQQRIPQWPGPLVILWARTPLEILSRSVCLFPSDLGSSSTVASRKFRSLYGFLPISTVKLFLGICYQIEMCLCISLLSSPYSSSFPQPGAFILISSKWSVNDIPKGTNDSCVMTLPQGQMFSLVRLGKSHFNHLS